MSSFDVDFNAVHDTSEGVERGSPFEEDGDCTMIE
jgi:hypothetical protein